MISTRLSPLLSRAFKNQSQPFRSLTSTSSPKLTTSIASYSYVMQNFNTRWSDNDIYTHMNNTKYLELFDTIINTYLISTRALTLPHGITDPSTAAERGPVGFCVASQCSYHAPVSFPEVLTLGLRVDKIGSSSVTYGVGVFRKDDDSVKAEGSFVHVFVDPVTGKKAVMPVKLRKALEELIV